MSQGQSDMRGPWNQGDQWEFVEDREKQAAVDGGDGSASVKLSRKDIAIAKKAAIRTVSDPTSDPTTGAGLGQGAARTTVGDCASSPTTSVARIPTILEFIHVRNNNRSSP